MCVLSRSSKTLYGPPEGEEVNGKFSILVFKDFGKDTKFGQKMKSVYCVEVVENGTESLGHIKKYILVVIFIIITNLCTQCVLYGLCDMFFYIFKCFVMFLYVIWV